ncbi:hypothetical protein [Rhizobium sp. SSA_523]|uniref:hypothetical protein n=1 Tax=Rhizobium sp. SSA_523 TaxID=2952477 RepID=UPI0020917806|nr:hypothetical protein [Rhizobium sp. SSA_523]MCO5730714.1 hypothetical protein [Rhizobium sp. SSA_523]WKC24461.1 hypothetical protein QTJ18_10390 [Rhizobium sp. SSA_523]
MNRTRTARLLLASASFALAASQAFALDGQDLLSKITAASNLQPGNLAVAGVDVSGSDVTLKGVTLGDDKGGERLKVGDIKLEDVQEESDGGYFISRVTLPDVNISEKETAITASSLYLTNVSVPADQTANNLDSILFYEQAHTGPINVTVNGKQVLGIRESEANLTREDDDSGVSFDAKVDGVSADLSLVEDPKTREAIESLGLTTLTGKLTMQGNWEMEPGTVNLEEYALAFDNVGRLNMSLSFSGYTLAFLKSVQETAKAAEANPNKEAAQQAAGLAMLGLMQQLTFNSASLSFEDSGITNRGLAFAGKTQGVSSEQMAMMVKGMAPLMLAQLNVPTLQNSLSTAINTFIDNPRNITITAEPANPVPLPMIIGTAQAAPNTLPDMLGVTVTAND